MSTINYSEKIPNNVNLSEDRTLQRALEQWQPNSLQWWMEMGPAGFQANQVYLINVIPIQFLGTLNNGGVLLGLLFGLDLNLLANHHQPKACRGQRQSNENQVWHARHQAQDQQDA